jgi:hypothetical protein
MIGTLPVGDRHRHAKVLTSDLALSPGRVLNHLVVSDLTLPVLEHAICSCRIPSFTFAEDPTSDVEVVTVMEISRR